MKSLQAERNASPNFWTLPADTGLLMADCDEAHPTSVHGWGWEASELSLQASDDSHFGFVYEGECTLRRELGGRVQELVLSAGMYFCVPGAFSVLGGKGIIVSRLGYHGQFSVGGPIEEVGRLRYIDGCSDSLLIPPVLKGDPCFNHLHFPRQISQTPHTHPTVRVGIVVKGSGRCVVPKEGGEDSIPLTPGRMFVIPAGGVHSFFTDAETMDVIAYHPDSDVGPEHDNHPMVNRTIVNGVSAAVIAEIRTRVIS